MAGAFEIASHSMGRETEDHAALPHRFTFRSPLQTLDLPGRKMRLRAESAFGAQYRLVQVQSDDGELPEGGAASPLPLALAEVGGDRE